MTDKDKEAFREFIHKGFGYSLSPYDIENYGEYRNHLSVGWSAACEYKDKEILEWKEAASSEAALVNELQSEIANLREQDKILSKEMKTYMTISENLRTVVKINQAENSKLRECVEFYAKTESWEADGWIVNADLHEPWGDQGISLGGRLARQVLKELEDK